jgi:hypothetical protein
MPLTALPEELVRNLIIRKYVVGDSPPTENILAVRAACRMFWKAVPVGTLLGLKDETPKWLFGGETKQWDKSMNTANLFVNSLNTPDHTGDDKRIVVGSNKTDYVYDYFENSSSRNASIHASEMKTELSVDMRTNLLIIVPNDYSIETRTITEANNTFESVCAWNTTYYLISQTGSLFKINPFSKAMQPNSLPLINHATDFVQKWVIPDHVKNILGDFKWFSFNTNNGEDFWFCSESHHLLFGNSTNANGQLITLAGNVERFELIDNAAVCMMTDGSVKLLTRKHHAGAPKFMVNIVAYGMINFTITKYPVYSIWFKNNSNQHFRRGLPLLTVENDYQGASSFIRKTIEPAKIRHISDLLLAAVTDMQADLNALADDTRAMASAAQR